MCCFFVPLVMRKVQKVESIRSLLVESLGIGQRVYILRNINNYARTLIILWENFFFVKCYWIKDLLSTVIQNKKYLVVFHKHKINSLHVYYLISCVLFGLFIFFFLYAKSNTWYTCKYFFQHVLRFSFYNLRFLDQP